MTLTPAEMDQRLEEHFRFEANEDVEGVLATLAEDAVQDVVGWPHGPSHGRESARNFYETLFDDLEEGKTTTIRRLQGHNNVVDETLWEGRATGRPFGIEGNNRQLSFRLLHIVDFNSEGKIQKEQFWLDVANMMQQLQAPPET
jgi:predicted ester cyclase